MLDLPKVTLCCIDTVNHALALRALRCSMAAIRFARTLFITDRDVGEAGIETRVIAPLDSRDAYSQFVLKSLLAHVETSHVLLIQWDGYVVNPDAWRDEFLGCDYIGAKWFWHEDAMRVGNGGFSLRSRKLLAALQDPRISLAGPEDETIGRVYRPLLEREHAIEFGSEALADAFAFEAAYPIGKPFGFHGLFNFCRVVPADELITLIVHFTPEIARSPQLGQLGRNCLAMGQWRAAAAIFRRILDETPGDPAAAAGLATASTNAAAFPSAGRNDPCPCGSGKRYKHCHGATASAAAPPSVDQRLATALSLHQRGDAAGAEAIYRGVLEASPDHAMAQHYLGVIAYQRGDAATALPLLERSVAAVPTEPEFRNNLGLAYAAGDRENEAIAAYRAALSLKPDHAVAWNNLGLALQSLNDVPGAIDAFRRAVELKPDFAHAHWNLSLALLLDGRFEEGWHEYDWRLSLPELGRDRHSYPGPAWDGAPATGKTLLLYAEQGLGDALQFARYATAVARLGARVIVHAPDPLCRLLATVPGVTEVLSTAAPPPRFDAHRALMSLPRLLGTTLGTIPADVPYVSATPERRSVARGALAARQGKLKVGLAWAGSRAHPNDRNRSCRLSSLSPLFDVADVAWFSLQQGEAAAQIAQVPGAAAMAPLAADATFDDTAALIAELDLVISVDTSIVHVSGALGRPCWVLLPFAPDWRWLLGREDSPWYPTLRLFRQERPRSWSEAVSRVVAALQARLGAPGERPREANAPPTSTRPDDALRSARDAWQRGDASAAEQRCRHALAMHPDDARAWTLLGIVLRERDPRAAQVALHRALEIDPRNADALFHLGNLHHAQRDFDAAVTAFERALALAPKHPSVLNNLGLALDAAGSPERARKSYEAVLEQKPDHPHALANLAHVLCRMRRYAEAKRLCERYLHQSPDGGVDLWVDYGICQHHAGDNAGAAASLRRALALAPADAVILTNLGSVLTDQGDYQGAEPLLAQAVARDANHAYAAALLAHCRARLCAWEGLASLHARVAELIESGDDWINPFGALSLPLPAASQLRVAKRWAADFSAPAPAPPRRTRSAARTKLRLGYVSSDFRTHPTAFLLTEVWERHDRERFETYAYSIGPREDSPLRSRIEAAFHRFADCADDDIDATVRRIEADGVDLLVDLNGYTTHARSEIFARRPAPVQLHWLGYLGTLGSDCIDYVITDRFATPPDLQASFTERFLYLPDCYCPCDTRREVAPRAPRREECGLPPRGFVFCSFNASYKILPAVFDVWMRLLSEVPGSVLWLAPGNAVAQGNLRREAALRGVDPARLIFAPQIALAQHLARLSLAELFLDTSPYNAGATAIDALFMGVPVLTCSGSTMASRVAGSQLHAIGLPELVTPNFAEYEALALELARTPELLARYRDRLRTNRSTQPLFDMARFARGLDDALSSAWQNRGSRAQPS